MERNQKEGETTECVSGIRPLEDVVDWNLYLDMGVDGSVRGFGFVQENVMIPKISMAIV